MRRMKLLMSVTAAMVLLAVAGSASAASLIPAGWKSTQLEGQSATLVSCTSKSFCMAVGGEDVYTYNGTSWSRFTRVDAFGWLTAVTCQSKHLCVVGDRSGDVVVYDGTSWSPPREVTGGARVDSISCPTSGFCALATGKGGIATYDGQTWSNLQGVDTAGGALYASCYAAGRCVAVDAHGNALMLHGDRWSKPVSVDPKGGGLRAISCTAANFCQAVDRHRHVFSFNGRRWTSVTLKNGGNARSISCTTGRHCVAVGIDGQGLYSDLWVYSHGSWDHGFGWGDMPASSVSCASGNFCMAFNPMVEVLRTTSRQISGSSADWKETLSSHLSGGQLEYVSCASASFCMAADGLTPGREFVFNGDTWKTAAKLPDRFSPIDALACPDNNFCVAEGWGLSVYKDGKWGPVEHREVLKWPGEVTCASSSFCMAVTTPDGVLIYNGQGWTQHKLSFQLSEVSCTSAGFCAGLDNKGKLHTFNGSSWSLSTASPPTLSLKPTTPGPEFTCSSPTFCIAVTSVDEGKQTVLESVTFNGTSWSQPQQINTVGLGAATAGLSCTANDDCLLTHAGSNNSKLFTYSGGQWSAGQTIDPLPSAAALASQVYPACSASGFCVAVGDGTADAMWSADPFGSGTASAGVTR